RPLVAPEIVKRGLSAARETGAAAAAVPVSDTIKQVGADAAVRRTVRRDGLWAVQTPQVFRYDLLLRAHEAALGGPEATDDAALVERLGHPVKIFLGSRRNIKVTTPEDLALAEALLTASPPPSLSGA
ncbi:MAG TPA: 2-C-methyl-D-erythritol 4-phosphate cytidylyltransferase, partial [Dehalococcoidia bacterium]|nr:2-C-methyl-D-erythritol 4-phosphate cytidylyltransferase [Dehalococcoidia bacterium]